MKKGNKVINYITGGMLGLVLLVFLIKFISDSPYRKGIPQLPDLKLLSAPVSEQLSLATKRARLNPTSDNLGLLGMTYHASALYEKAMQCYQLAVKRNRHKWLWSYYLGYLNRELGESAMAIENFKLVTRENPKMHLALYYIGEGLQSLGKNDQAEATYIKIINNFNLNQNGENAGSNDFFPLSTYARFQLARLYMNTQRLDQAEKTLIEIISVSRNFGPAYRVLGNVYRLNGDSVLSKEYIVQANDLTDYASPLDKLVDGISLLSRSDQYLMKQIDEAEKKAHPEFALGLADHAFKYMPDNKYLISKKIKLLLFMNKGRQSLPYLDQDFKYFNDDFIELKEVANLLYNAGLFEQAGKYYTRAAELKKTDTEVQSSIVLCLWKEGMKDQALQKMNSLIINDKENIKILASGVYVMLSMGEKETARKYLVELGHLAPSNPKLQLMLGMEAELNGNLPAATAFYESSFKSNPKDLATVHALSNALTKQKMWRKTISTYRKALEYFPNEPYLLEELGTLLVDCSDPSLRNINDGMKYSNRAFIHKASTPDITIAAGKSIAIAYASQGDYRKAFGYIEWALSEARKQNAPAEYINDLGKLFKEYNEHNQANGSGN